MTQNAKHKPSYQKENKTNMCSGVVVIVYACDACTYRLSSAVMCGAFYFRAMRGCYAALNVLSAVYMTGLAQDYNL